MCLKGLIAAAFENSEPLQLLGLNERVGALSDGLCSHEPHPFYSCARALEPHLYMKRGMHVHK